MAEEGKGVLKLKKKKKPAAAPEKPEGQQDYPGNYEELDSDVDYQMQMLRYHHQAMEHHFGMMYHHFYKAVSAHYITSGEQLAVPPIPPRPPPMPPTIEEIRGFTTMSSKYGFRDYDDLSTANEDQEGVHITEEEQEFINQQLDIIEAEEAAREAREQVEREEKELAEGQNTEGPLIPELICQGDEPTAEELEQFMQEVELCEAYNAPITSMSCGGKADDDGEDGGEGDVRAGWGSAKPPPSPTDGSKGESVYVPPSKRKWKGDATSPTFASSASSPKGGPEEDDDFISVS